MPTFQIQFEAASTVFFDEISGNIEAIATGIELLDLPIPNNFDFTSFGPYNVAKLNYVNALTASLAEIDVYQAQGISHYNPAYLQGAHNFLRALMGSEYDLAIAQPALLQQVTNYGNLYNSGTWTNVITWLRQREIGRYAANFLGWYGAGGVNSHQDPEISLQFEYSKNSEPRIDTIKVGVYWTLKMLKDLADDLYGNPPFIHRIAIRRPSGDVLAPDTQTLIELGLQNGDRLNADLIPTEIHPGPHRPGDWPGGLTPVIFPD